MEELCTRLPNARAQWRQPLPNRAVPRTHRVVGGCSWRAAGFAYSHNRLSRSCMTSGAKSVVRNRASWARTGHDFEHAPENPLVANMTQTPAMHMGHDFQHCVHNRASWARTGRDYEHIVRKPQVTAIAKSHSMHTRRGFQHCAQDRASYARMERDLQRAFFSGASMPQAWVRMRACGAQIGAAPL